MLLISCNWHLFSFAHFLSFSECLTPDQFSLNFAVPSLNSLHKLSKKYDLDAAKPGFLEEALNLFSDRNQNKDIKLAFDGKKLAYGIGHSLGEDKRTYVDICSVCIVLMYFCLSVTNI